VFLGASRWPPQIVIRYPAMASYDLDVIASAFTTAGISADVRGRDRALFVYARHAGRAVELSGSDLGIWVEFWDRDQEYPKFDRTIPTQADAIEVARSWLSG
jgi:hypothetical protein